MCHLFLLVLLLFLILIPPPCVYMLCMCSLIYVVYSCTCIPFQESVDGDNDKTSIACLYVCASMYLYVLCVYFFLAKVYAKTYIRSILLTICTSLIIRSSFLSLLLFVYTAMNPFALYCAYIVVCTFVLTALVLTVPRCTHVKMIIR